MYLNAATLTYHEGRSKNVRTSTIGQRRLRSDLWGPGFVDRQSPTEGHGPRAQGKRDCGARNGLTAGGQTEMACDDSRGGPRKGAGYVKFALFEHQRNLI